MDIIVSNSSDLPFYQQIKIQIKNAILKGALREGDLLPSIRNLADDLQVSVLTIRRVYNELEAEGFVNSRMGKGTFVSVGNSELIKESKRHLIEEDLLKAIINAKTFDISKKEIMDMIDVLFEEDLWREQHFEG